MSIVDSHCHLAGEEFSADLDAVAARAREAGVTDALCILEAEDASEMARAAVVARAWPAMKFAAGIHPHHAGRFAGRADEAFDIVCRALISCGASAVGEIGLDYHYDLSPRDVQQEIFRRQVALSRQYNMPIIIHTREATDDTFRIIREEQPVSGVFHCFTGDREMARKALDLGFFLSFAGIITFPKAEELREAARFTPLDRLLSETDAPYLAPVPHRGKRNEPALVTRVVETLAGLHGVDGAVIARRIRANFQLLFGLAR